MKKISILLIALLTILVFTSASVWEGTATASIGNEFPDTGYYAATNSYPINTVVDITNLENGRTLRVIVMSNLENPGLLVVLSRDAASALGINPRSIGRVRMNQPSDAIAYSRFIGGYGAGDPDHDPAAMLAATPPNPELFTPESWTALNEEIFSEESLTHSIITEDDHAEIAEADVFAAPELVYFEPEHSITDIERVESISAVEPIDSLDMNPEELDPLASSPHSFYDRLDEYEFVITPDFERLPPDYIYFIIDPSDIVDTWYPGIYETQPEQPQPEMAEHAFVPPVTLPEKTEVPQTIVEIPQDYTIPEELLVPEIAIPSESAIPKESFTEPAEYAFVPPIAVPEPAALAPVNGFSVPVINSLERGMYYIQIGAYSRIDTVESELDRHSSVYPMVVQDAGSPENPLYRVLVGPLNLGESGAMLHRFRGTYSDAFVRQGQ